jgi:hypothetical protein
MRDEELNSDESEAQDSGENFEESDASFVTGERKASNASTFGVLGLVVLVGAGLYFFYLKNGPQNAAAATIDQTAASATINEFLHGNGGNAKLMEQTLHNTEKVVQEFQSHSKKNQIPLEELQTNPFRLKVPKPEVQESEAVPSKIRADEERQRIVTEANALELQSVVRGGRSACLVNNLMYHEGEQVGSFTIDEIRPKSVIVRQGKFRFELTMKK